MTDLPTWSADVAALTEKLDAMQYGLDALFGRVPLVDLAGAGPHDVIADYYGKELLVSKGSSGAAVIRMAATAARGSMIVATGLDCTLSVTAATGATIESWQGHGGSAAAGAPIYLICRANSDGASAIWMLRGATA